MPVVRTFVGEEHPWSERWYTVVAVVTAAAMLASPLLVPLGRWCVKVKKTDWTKVKAPNEGFARQPEVVERARAGLRPDRLGVARPARPVELARRLPTCSGRTVTKL